MESSLLFKPGTKYEDTSDVFDRLEKMCVSDNVASLTGEAFQHIIKAQMKLFDLRNVILFQYGIDGPSQEVRQATESHIQRAEDRLRSAAFQFSFLEWPLMLTEKGKQYLNNVDIAVAEASSYEEFITKLNELNKQL